MSASGEEKAQKIKANPKSISKSVMKSNVADEPPGVGGVSATPVTLAKSGCSRVEGILTSKSFSCAEGLRAEKECVLRRQLEPGVRGRGRAPQAVRGRLGRAISVGGHNCGESEKKVVEIGLRVKEDGVVQVAGDD
jgi:hypothetical protein